jgi:ABC-2 type transport system ATP-binding protein
MRSKNIKWKVMIELILGVIAGAIFPDSGEVHIFGRHRRISDHSIKKDIAYVPDACPIYPFITGDEFLAFVQSIRNSSALKLEHLLNIFRLQGYRRTRFGKMSLGITRKFMLISALMTEAKIFVLDDVRST